jgi:hypothetical protein
VSVPPRWIGSGLSAIWRDRSASGGPKAVAAVALFGEAGSVGEEALAVLKIGFAPAYEAGTRYVAVTVLDCPGWSVLSGHGKPAAQGAETLWRTRPGGVGSSRTMSVASPLPAFRTLMV